MSVQYAGNQFMSERLVEDVIHKVMCKALEYQAELSTLKSKEAPHRCGQR